MHRQQWSGNKMRKLIMKSILVSLGLFFVVTTLLAEEKDSLEYWRLRHTARGDRYIMSNFEAARRVNIYPLLSISAIAGMCGANPKIINNLPPRYQEIVAYAWERYKEAEQTPRYKSIEYQSLTSLYLINGELDKAIEANREARKWLWQDIERQKIETKDYKATPLLDSDILYYKSLGFQEIALIQLANKEFGKHYAIDYSMLKDVDWVVGHPSDIQSYLGLLIILGEPNRFESFAQSEIHKKGKSKLLMSKEIASMIFDDMLLTKSYWLTPDFRKAIERLKKEADKELPSCRLADSYNMKCVPWDAEHPRPANPKPNPR